MLTGRMQGVFFGTRGSAPQTGEDYSLYGGNTSCLAFVPENDNEPALIVDAGTGLAACGEFLLRRRCRSCTILFTHGHLDHICGLPSFLPFFYKEWNISIYYPLGIMNDPLEKLFDGKTFPLKKEQLEANIFIQAFVPGLPFLRGIESVRVEHGAEDGCAFLVGGHDGVFVSGDCENPGRNKDLCRMIKKAGILVCDATYPENEICFRRGWGHSCAEDWLPLRRSGQHIYITHHEGVDSRLAQREQGLKGHGNIVLAREKMNFFAGEF